jgi:4-amino-4-deoxy-L-arabinose transferase-like glycosyltransferase
MSRPGAAAGPRGPWRPWIAVLGVALIARLAIVALTPPVIVWPDGREYDAIARSLVEHGTYGTQTLRPPGYPTLMAAVYAVFGPSLPALRVVEALLGVASVGVVGAVGASVFGPVAGLVAAGLMALHPILAFLPATQYSENTLVLTLALAFGAVFAAWRRGGLGRWAVAGALFGVATLIRPNVVVLLPGLGLGLLVALRRERRPWALPALVAAAALVLTVAPWIARNHRVHGEWFFVASGGGRQFWVGNNPRATGDTRAPTQWSTAERESLRSYRGDLARERWFYREGMRFVRAEPGRAARLYGVRLANLFALWPETHSRTAYVGAWSRAAQGLASAVIFAGVALALARRRSDPAVWPLVGAVVSFALVNAAFFTVLRYRMAFEPCLLWLAGAGWASLGGVAGIGRRIGVSR